ncbi:hypothetical protein [Bradyrhizobium sp.]|uniref:hypothetical protein n=1 Tax=Bradyrhizobium sp. TaxID=376 RepID=UPI0039C8801D
MRQVDSGRKGLLLLALAAPLMAGCSGGISNMMSSDLLSKDADWFARSGRVFIKNVSIETAPLTPDKPITPDDLISAEGQCSGMAPPGAPADANALTDGATGVPTARPGAVALLHTECDVVRGIGAAPDNVSLSNNARGDRVAVLTYSRGSRPGIYTFTSGRLSSVERGPEPAAQPKTAKPKAKKKPAAT